MGKKGMNCANQNCKHIGTCEDVQFYMDYPDQDCPTLKQMKQENP